MNKTNFGEYLHQLRTERELPLRSVADKLGIDISLLSKIEHGERFVQPHMLPGIAELFQLDERKLEVEFISQRIFDQFGNSRYFLDSVLMCLNKSKHGD